MSKCDRTTARLHAYHDRELGPWARWRLERHLGRCAACRFELDRLRQVGDWVRGAAALEETPDLWGPITMRLPALDREVESAASPRRAVRPGFPRFAVPLGAGVAVATAALVVLTLFGSEPPRMRGAVRSLYSPTQSVMVLEDSEDSTIIWVMETPIEQHSGELGHAFG
jgi:anti-sigma factor RsiW